MVAAAVAAELADFVVEVAELLLAVEKPLEAQSKGVGRSIVADVEAVLAAACPFGGNAEGLAHFGACALGDDLDPGVAADLAALSEPSAAPGPRRWEDAGRSRRSAARRILRSATASAGMSICSRLIEHLMSTPTGPG